MKAIKRILVPTDFSDNARAAFDYALNLAEDMKASIKVVHIYTDFTPEMAIAEASYVAGGKSIAEVNEALANFVVEGINQYAQANNIEMVVAVTKHRRFWDRILHSSKTKEMAIYSELPVLIIKAED